MYGLKAYFFYVFFATRIRNKVTSLSFSSSFTFCFLPESCNPMPQSRFLGPDKFLFYFFHFYFLFWQLTRIDRRWTLFLVQHQKRVLLLLLLRSDRFSKYEKKQLDRFKTDNNKKIQNFYSPKQTKYSITIGTWLIAKNIFDRLSLHWLPRNFNNNNTCHLNWINHLTIELSLSIKSMNYFWLIEFDDTMFVVSAE